MAKFLDTDATNLDRTFDDLENRYLALESRQKTLVIDFKAAFTPEAIDYGKALELPEGKL